MNQIIRLNDVMARTGLKRATVYNQIAAGKFPRSIQLTERCVGWDAAEIDEWITKRLKAKSANQVESKEIS